ncbi:DUF6894 family protein [Bradyrhizobium cytisi]|uniref:DUF6894 family protein n=1 Tax=Bradyrhizobium cytisi TaxID=515489 RepID=UPI001652E708|nr:hypothetical protein [Bradyrhizobium cytisi]
MTRFFFHVHGGISVLDDVGLELPDIDAAEATVIELSRQILKEEPEGPMWQDNEWRVQVTDSLALAGRLPLSVSLQSRDIMQRGLSLNDKARQHEPRSGQDRRLSVASPLIVTSR